MDLETENRIAALLLKDSAELRRQAQKEGALAYLRQPTVRSRPNICFLTATVRGVQQANRAVEVNEMWRLREKQLELDNRLRGARKEDHGGRGLKDVCEPRRNTTTGCNQVEKSASASLSFRKRSALDLDPMEDDGLRDDEVDEFLQARTKRGRGAIGSRIDETGPYLPSSPDSMRTVLESDNEELKKARVLLGPKKPSFLMPSESSDDEFYRDKKTKAKVCSSKGRSKKHKRKEMAKYKKKKKSKREKK